MESLLASLTMPIALLPYSKLYSQMNPQTSTKVFVVNYYYYYYYYYYHPNESADLAAAMLRASSGNADPL
jgi:hypothetical protein